MKSNRLRRKSLSGLQNLLFRTATTNSPPSKVLDTMDPYAYAEAIVEAVHEPILILDKSLTIRSANKTFYKTFKLMKKQTLGTNLVEIAAQDHEVKDLVEKLKELSTKNTSFDEVEISYRFEKVGVRTLVLNARRILLGKLATEFILLEIEDITKRKLIEQQKDDFIGYVTHELKTPITTVTAFIQIMQGYHAKTGDKKSQFLLAKIANQMERLTGLLNSFANVYKAQTGKIEIHKQQVNISKLVHEVVEAFQYTTSTHDLLIKGEIEKEIPADKERIHEVLINLIINAIKYSPHGNKVVIKMIQKPKEVIISVKDFGFGISKEEQKKVFERFFRVKGKTENKIEGLGLGLYLVSEIIKQHGGKIWVKSILGKGSTFAFSLPVN